MQLSETACEILEFFRETHREPGARMTMATLDAHFGTDPTVALAVPELIHLGYVTTPDAATIELTDLGFDAIHRGVARSSSSGTIVTRHPAHMRSAFRQ
jgi:hypothetical protein